jgi:hypothetical protein
MFLRTCSLLSQWIVHGLCALGNVHKCGHNSAANVLKYLSFMSLLPCLEPSRAAKEVSGSMRYLAYQNDAKTGNREVSKGTLLVCIFVLAAWFGRSWRPVGQKKNGSGLEHPKPLDLQQ